MVIGSGIGGLCVAARLCHAGYKTLILEKMPILGGRYTFVDYKGYCLPVGAATIYYGEKDPVLTTLRDVSSKTDFEMKALPSPKWRIKGADHEMPKKGALWHTISLASQDKHEEERVVSALRQIFMSKDIPTSITFDEMLHSVTDNKTIWKIFNALSIQIWGLNLYEITATDFVNCFRNYAGVSLIIPKPSLRTIIDALAKAIRDNNGEILTTMQAHKILVDRGTVIGVEAKSKNVELSIQARIVISNMGIKKTIELAGERKFDSEYLKEVKETKSLNGFWFFIASDEPLYDWPGGLYTIDTRRPDVWTNYTATWPELAPEGKHLMGLYQGPAEQSNYSPREEYEIFMADLADTFPYYKQYGAEILLMRQFRSEWPCVRAWPSLKRQKTPVKNLYNVGDAVCPEAWVGGSGAADSARIVAEEIIGQIKI